MEKQPFTVLFNSTSGCQLVQAPWQHFEIDKKNEEKKKARMDTNDSLKMPEKIEDIKFSIPMKKNFSNVIKLKNIPHTSMEKKL